LDKVVYQHIILMDLHKKLLD